MDEYTFGTQNQSALDKIKTDAQNSLTGNPKPYDSDVPMSPLKPENNPYFDDSSKFSTTPPTENNNNKSEEGEHGVMLSNEQWSTIKSSYGSPIYGLHPTCYGEPSGTEYSPDISVPSKWGYAKSILVDIHPAWASFGSSGDEKGLQIMSLDVAEGKKKWHGVLKNLSDYIDDPEPPTPLRLAIQNDVSIADSWGHGFGDTMFEGMLNVGSRPFMELKAITGGKNIGEVVQKVGEKTKIPGLEDAGEFVSKFQEKLGSLGGGIGNQMQRLLEGSKVDFPTIWQSSNFDPQYQITVRLYNPNPQSKALYKRFILTPLAYILAFACPLADSNYTYSFPLMCKVRCPGLFYLPAGFISSVQVLKGGDTQDITFHQQPGMVDVRISFDSLYSVMVAAYEEEDKEDKNKDRPTLKKYFESLWDWVDYEKLNGPDVIEVPRLPDAPEVIGSVPDELLEEPVSRVSEKFEEMATSLNNMKNSIESSALFEKTKSALMNISNSMSSISTSVDSFSSSLNLNINSFKDNLQILNIDVLRTLNFKVWNNE